MSTYIYTVLITLDKPYESTERIGSIGYIPFYSDDPEAPRQNATIRWTESKVVDETLTLYAPIIKEISEIETVFEPDSPVVQQSEVSITVDNVHKIPLLLNDNDINLTGQLIQIFLNEFNSTTGALMSSRCVFNGSIVSYSFTETDLNISCENNKFLRKSNVLKDDDDLLTVGTTTIDTHFAVDKIDTIENPAVKILSFSGANSFLILGFKDDILPDSHNVYNIIQRYYYVYFMELTSLDLPNLALLQGSWMKIENSSSSAKGEYRQVLLASAVSYADMVCPYKNYYPADGHYYKIMVDGFFTSDMNIEVKVDPSNSNSLFQKTADMVTYVSFYRFNFEYNVSKIIESSGALENVYVKVGDTFQAIQRSFTTRLPDYWDMTYELNNSHLNMFPRFINDEKTAITYSSYPCTGLQYIPDETLAKWQADKFDNDIIWTDPSSIWSKIFQFSRLYNFPADPLTGMFTDDDFEADEWPGIQNSIGLVDPTYINNRIFDPSTDTSYAWHSMIYWAQNPCVLGFEVSLPAIPDDFTFKNCYLGVVIASHCANKSNMPDNENAYRTVRLMTREKQGNAQILVDIKLNQTAGGVISTIPPQYFETWFPDDKQYQLDWQEEYIEPTWKLSNGVPVDVKATVGVHRYTKPIKIDIDTVEAYRKIDKIGLLFERGLTDHTFIPDNIKFYQICIIFTHENDLTELYL